MTVAPAMVKRKTTKRTSMCMATGRVAALSLEGRVNMGQKETKMETKAAPEKRNPALTKGADMVSRVMRRLLGAGGSWRREERCKTNTKVNAAATRRRRSRKTKM